MSVLTEALEANVTIFGVIRPRYEWEMLEGYLGAEGVINEDSPYNTIQQISRHAGLPQGRIEIPGHVSADPTTWLTEITSTLALGCEPYQVVEEVQDALRERTIFMRSVRDWCGEGTNTFLDQMGLRRLDGEGPMERHDDATIQEVMNRYRTFVGGNIGAGAKPGTLRAIERGRPPTGPVVGSHTPEVTASEEMENARQEVERLRVENERLTNRVESQQRALAQAARFSDSVRAKIIEIGEEQGWDTNEVNEILDELGLELIEQDYDVTIEYSVTGYWTTTVTASDEDSAREQAMEEANNQDIDLRGDYGSLDNISVDGVDVHDVEVS